MDTNLNLTTDKVHMETLVSALNKLHVDGYTSQFKANANGLLSLTTNQLFTPKQVNIKHFYRFEGDTSPSNSSILYAIETHTKEKGTLIDAYGVDSDENVAEFIRHVEEIHK